MAVLSAKTYTVRIGESAVIGNSAVHAGSYVLKLDGPSAMLMDKKGNTIASNGVVASGGQKFMQTEVDTATDSNGQARVHEIDLGGTHTSVTFNQ
jgi:hypothetical protein